MKRYTTVRVSMQTREVLRRIAAREGTAMPAALDRALEAYRRKAFLEDVNAAYARVRADEAEWRTVEDERAAWDVALRDGLSEPAPAARTARHSRRPRPQK